MTFQPDYLLIDGTSLMIRAFHTMPTMIVKRGQPIGAITGVLNILNKVEAQYPDAQPIMVFSSTGETERHAIFQDYNVSQNDPPEDQLSQVQQLKLLVSARGWNTIVLSEIEAKDIIGSLSMLIEENDKTSLIISHDRSLTQMVNDICHYYHPTKGRWDAKDVQEALGVRPALVPDMLALSGDPVFNIPGVVGVGDKTSSLLMETHKSIKGLIKAVQQGVAKVNKRQKAHLEEDITSHRIELWQDLSTIRLNVMVDMKMLKPSKADPARLKKLYEQLGIKDSSSGKKSSTNHADDGYWQLEFIANPEDFLTAIDTAIQKKGIAGKGIFAIPKDPEYLELGVDTLCIFFQHEKGKEAFMLSLKDVESLEKINAWVVKHDDSQWVTPQWKLSSRLLHTLGLELPQNNDFFLASYLLDASQKITWEALADQHGLFFVKYDEMAGTGKKRQSFSSLLQERQQQLLTSWLDISTSLHDSQFKALKKFKKLNNLYQTIEKPLMPLLSGMERLGVKLDLKSITSYDKELTKEIDLCQQRCYDLAGKEFSVDSLNQLRQILFHDLKLPVIGKTPKGQASTSESVLEELAEMGHALPTAILEYRGLTRLKTHYTSSLPTMIDEVSGRIHCIWQQTEAISGRLSSIQPNLQQIPVRTEAGKKIRRAVVVEEGYKLIKADYSQIELRVMAHFSKDPVLLSAFSNGDDVHSATASSIFDVKLEDVTPELRQKAKAVNFGLIYGISAFGLAKQLKITQPEAASYMEGYFKRLKKVDAFMKKIPETGRKNGYVETLMGRRIQLKEISDTNHARRSYAERLSINGSLQGTAADIIKSAMIRLDKALLDAKLDAKIIMQIHDELVLEVAEKDAKKAGLLLKEAMESAGNDVLSVPVLADVSIGDNFQDTSEFLSD